MDEASMRALVWTVIQTGAGHRSLFIDVAREVPLDEWPALLADLMARCWLLPSDDLTYKIRTNRSEEWFTVSLAGV